MYRLLFCLVWTLWISQAHMHAQADEKPLVLASASMLHDMAKNIGGDLFRYDMIVPVGGDPHLHEPTPRDARICNEATLILKNGLTFEGWLNKLIENSGTEAIVRTVTEGVAAIRSQQYENATDPHAWMDASNGLIYVQNIRDAMIALMPGAEESFRENYTIYKSQIEETDAYVSRKLGSLPEDKRILITSHDAFQYFGRRYGVRLEAVLGTSTDADVQTSDIRRLNEVIQTSRVPAVFIESTINPRLLEQIAKDNGVVVGGQLYADSLSDEDGPANTYIKMLRHNAETIFNGLSLERENGGDSEYTNSAQPSFTWLWGLLLAPILLAVVIFVIRIFRH